MSGTIARLHLSESPYGPSPDALAAAHAALDQTSVYPDPARSDLIAAIATHYGVRENQVAVANGSDELVLLTALALGDTRRPGVTTAATFPGYAICLRQAGRGCAEVALADGAVDVDAFVAALDTAGIAYLCNPHNPSGAVLTSQQLSTVVAACSEAATPLIADEAYMEFAPPGTPSVLDLLDDTTPVLALRTFSKAYGLAALRIGYAIGHPDLVRKLRDAQQTMPFSANRIGQAAALAALSDTAHLDHVREQNAKRRQWFTTEATRRGRDCLPSATNFVTVAVADSATAEKRLADEHGILVRDAGRFGYAGYLRVSLGGPADLIRMLDALAEMDL